MSYFGVSSNIKSLLVENQHTWKWVILVDAVIRSKTNFKKKSHKWDELLTLCLLGPHSGKSTSVEKQKLQSSVTVYTGCGWGTGLCAGHLHGFGRAYNLCCEARSSADGRILPGRACNTNNIWSKCEFMYCVQQQDQTCKEENEASLVLIKSSL